MTKLTVPVLVINLDRSPERMTAVAKNLTALELPFVRIPAIDGANESDEVLYKNYSAVKNIKEHYRPLKRGEIACYLSHRKACEYIIKNKLDCALVLEDDAILNLEANEFLKKAALTYKHWDIVKLFYGAYQKKTAPITTLPLTKDNGFALWKKVPTSTMAQLISYEGAKKIIELSNNFGRPIDLDMRSWWLHNLKIFNVIKPLVSNTGAASDIEMVSGKRKVKDYPRLKKIFLRLKFSFGWLTHQIPASWMEPVRKELD